MTPISSGVGYDLSRESDLAIDLATEHARRVGGRLSVLHIRTPMPGQVFSPDGAFGWQLWTTVSDDDPAPALPGVERAKAVLGEDAVSVEVSTGSAPGRLVEGSQTADLVVVGSHGHGVLMTTLVGSTAYAVAAHAQCPVSYTHLDVYKRQPIVHHALTETHARSNRCAEHNQPRNPWQILRLCMRPFCR